MKARSTLLLFALAAAVPAAAQDLSRWRYHRTLTLDTTAAGAGVAGDVKAYPLAVALDETSFDFTQAKPDGSDLRFTRTPEGGPLPHHVEHWDAGARRAAVWVKLDLVKGGDAAQSLVMHWGNPQALDAGSGKAVFDSKDGFVGVWHLGEEGNVEEGGYKDATGTEAHATGVNLAAGARVDGRIGGATTFQHVAKQWIKLENNKRRHFDLTTKGTVSIWAKANGYKNQGEEGKALPGYETLFAKGDNSWRLQKFGIRSWHKPPSDLIEMCVEEPPRADLCVVGKTDMATGQWFHVVAVHDFPRAKLYVNGALETAETFDVNWTSGDHPVGIGNQSQFPAQGRFWDGVLDEARVLRVPKDDHWIKLDYESQREGSRLVRFGPVQQRPYAAGRTVSHLLPQLLVVEKRAERLSAYDPASGRALWSVPAGPKPHEFALSRDGRFAFVTNYGVDSFTEAGPGANTITVIDLAQRERIGEIDLGDSRRPHGIEVAASGRLYVTADHPPRLLVIDPARRQIVRRYELGQSLPHMLAVTRDETKAYTANSGAGTVSVVALDRDETKHHLEIGGIPQGFAWSEDGKRLFASNRSGNAVFVIDPARDEIVGRLEIPGQPARLRVAPGTPYLVVSLLEAGDVAVVDTRSLRVLHRAHVGSRSEGVTVDGSGRFGYVSCQDEDKVVRFSIPDARPVAEIRTGGKPDPLVVVEPK